ncbi:MAG: oligosaccharide flippase family protein [Pseudomonadota bacterium]
MTIIGKGENRNFDNPDIHPNLGNKDSLNKRYFFKLSSNFLGLIISVITQLIIPRGLGPKAYGDFNFLTNFFTQVVGFLDMGTSTCFYTNISRNPEEHSLILFYLYFIAFVSFFVIGFVLLVHFSGIHETIWIGQNLVYIYLAAGWGLLSWFAQILGTMADAYGLTVPAEKVRMLQRISGLVFIVLLYLYNQIYLPQIFFYNYFILLFLIIVLIGVIGSNVHLAKKNLRLSWDSAKKYLKVFFNYSHPLFIIALFGLVGGIFDRWLLQYFGGSIQQGFYSLSYQIGTICFLFTGAMTPLLMREYSILHGTNNLNEMGRLFKRYVPILYAIAAYFSCFLMVQAQNVVRIIGGSAFQGSIMAVAIMSLYPVHQTYGQLTGSLFYATGRTKLYRNITVIFSLVSLPLTYFMIAPFDKFGLNAGATGLAIKMVIINIIAVNVQLYFNTKLLHLSYLHYLVHQIGCLFFFTGLAAMSALVANYLFADGGLYDFILSGIIYTMIVIVSVYFKPEILDLKSKDVKFLVQLIRNRFTDVTQDKC